MGPKNSIYFFYLNGRRTSELIFRGSRKSKKSCHLVQNGLLHERVQKYHRYFVTEFFGRQSKELFFCVMEISNKKLTRVKLSRLDA